MSACATDGDKAVRTSAFDCMLRVADLYYASLRPYIEQLAGITSAAALGPEEDVAVRAVEFWNSLAEEEKGLELTDPDNCQYIKTYVAPLVGMLTSLMRKVEEEHDDEAYTIAQAASNCLTSVALAAQDAVVPPVMEFIATAFGAPEWQQRDAATVAFGCVQEGPSEEQLKPLIESAVGTLISRLAGPGADPSTQVRDSTAWALCKIMEANFELVDHATHYAPLLDAIFAALADEARVAANAAWIVHNMAPHMVDYELKDGSTPLTPYFQRLCEALIVRADRDDWEEHKLRTVCYEAVNMLVEGAVTEHEHPFLNSLLMEVGRRLTLAVNAAPAASPDERRNIESQLVLLAALTQALSGELDAEIAPVAPGLVELLMRAMDAHNAIAAENALYAIGSIADAVGESFKPMLPALMPKLQAAVTKVANTSVCEAGVWACGEIVRNAGSAVLPYIEGVINSLLELLKSAESPRRAKTTALAVFGDVATAMGPAVHTYIRGMMLIIHRAALTTAEVSARGSCFCPGGARWGLQRRGGLLMRDGSMFGSRCCKGRWML
jgi:importin subunit beta-1